MGYLGNQITTVFPTSISVDSLTVGDSHTIGNQSSNDNLLIKSSSSENIEFDSINGSHIFKKNDTENFRINDDGEVRVTDNLVFSTSGKGVYLGVTSATAANLLDDFEEGTFTPTWAGYDTSKINSTSGKYVKVGNQVTVYIKLVTGTASDASSVSVNNLPFTISGDIGAGSVYHNIVGLREMDLVTRFNSNSTTCLLDGILSGSDTTIKYVGTNPQLGGSSTLMWILHYQTI
jgi:hypothetical protein|tara:strand:+ start:505 stop:1203 length:699 start_codon:yes stop_codon:yes gene_type:complete